MNSIVQSAEDVPEESFTDEECKNAVSDAFFINKFSQDVMASMSGSDEYAEQVEVLLEHLKCGQVQDAIAGFERLISLGADHRLFGRCLALAYCIAGDYAKALYYLQEAVWLDPQCASLYVLHARVSKALEKPLDALMSYQKAVVLNGAFTEALVACDLLTKKLGIQQHSERYCNIMGLVNQELGFYHEAEQWYCKTLKVNSTNSLALHNLAIVTDVLEQERAFVGSGLDVIPARLLPIVTMYEYATIAESVYKDAAKAFPPLDWRVLVTSEDEGDEDGSFSRDGFYSQVYVNHVKKHVIIAVQGTKETRDLISDLHLAFNALDRQWVCAKVFTERVMSLLKLRGIDHYDVSFTGHSLGAAKAEFLGYLFRRKVVTFESPGSYEILEKIHSRIPEYAECDPLLTDITSYVPRPNLINTLKTHIGNLIRIYPAISLKFNREESERVLDISLDVVTKFLSIFSTLQTMIDFFTGFKELLKFMSQTELILLETAYWHSMANICQIFRYEYEAGIPPKQKHMNGWPSLIDHYYTYWSVSIECKTSDPDLEPRLGLVNTESLKFSNYLVDRNRDLLSVPLSEFSQAEIQFLQNYKSNPKSFDLSQLDHRLLKSYSLEGNKVITNVGVSPEHWKSFVSLKVKQLLHSFDEIDTYNSLQPNW